MPGFNLSPTSYFTPTYLICWLLLGWLVLRPKWGNRLFLPFSLVLLFLLRLPSICFNNEINPDESQMITQAMTLAQDPVYFRSVDGTTGGPLDSYALVVPSWVGLPFDYISAHLLAFGLIALFLIFTFRAAQLWFGIQSAQLALFPLVLLLGMTQNGDFLHYNSELVAIVLLALATYLLARQQQSVPVRPQLFLIGFLLGMVPFGKLQGVPLAAVVGLFTGIDVLRRPTFSVPQKAGQLAILGVGSLLFPALFVLFMAVSGQLDSFVTFYIEGNFNYATGGNQLDNLLHLPRFFGKGSEFAWLVSLTIALLAIWFAASQLTRPTQNGLGVSAISADRANRADHLFYTGFLSLLTLITFYAITRTGSEYVHYLFFLMGPLMLWMAYIWSALLAYNQPVQWLGLGLVAVYLLSFGVQALSRYQQGTPMNPYPSDNQGGWHLPKADIVKEIVKYAQPGEKLVVWGWRCDYYVQAQMPQGVAENHTIRSTFAHPMLDIYQRRYVADFKRSFPPVFVDAVGSQNLWMNDRKTQGFEIISPLAQFVSANYRYVGLFNDARLYVRNDRFNANR
ncbi:hypothetical protein F5984_22995 [Rudanella paleaurantiibacter]|uniref:Glycosyltransferase RgtA/B/C/D-like domain-containing protein n=1 Tax=Rudanella paleaurantiibacter TaxID=2614655 RepID=A0A7J5TTM1_9BACT|nr:hypothetical protein [Rudanella paleaurantiibacter]KAB7727104.1 hypothetical protein F5984_22995 [Rudanella paleaurantiibacter]